jgi:hypothetical protein
VKARRPGLALLLPGFLAALLVAGDAGLALAQGGTLRGTVRSAQTGEPLAGPVVTVLELGRRVFGDSLGGFVVEHVPAGDWRVDVRRVGFHPATLSATVHAGRETALDVRLEAAPITLPEFTTVARSPERERFDEAAQVSTRSLGIRDIRAVPALAEPDLLRTVQLLPGVVARNDYSVGLNVRGGDADQNLVLLDGQVVFNPFHLGGLVSTFADDAVQGLDFLAGGFPARYGGRLSSVLDVAEREGGANGLHGSAAVSLLSAKLHFEGPLPRRAGSWIVAARRTYADGLVAAFSSEEFPYHFQDLLARATMPDVFGGVLSVSGFASGDFFRLTLTEATTGRPRQDFRFDWGNGVAGLAYRRAVGAHGTLTQHAGVSRFFADIDVGPDLFTFRNRVERIGLSGDLEYRVGPHDLAAGYVLERHAITYFSASPSLDLEYPAFRYRPAAVEAYVEDQWRPRSWLLLRPGLRFTAVSGTGFRGIAPRFSAKAFLSNTTALSVAAGRYYQYVQSLRNEEIPITLFEFWIGADSAVPISSADHAVLGIEHWVSPDLSVSLEGYWKRMGNLVDENPADDPGVQGDEFRRARGRAFGLDFYVRKTGGRVTGWVSYSLGKVTRVTADGERFAPAQDRRHNLNVVAGLSGFLGADWTVRFGYGSPLPYTAIAGQWIHRYYDPDRNQFVGVALEPYRTERNAERYPAYSRVDVSARWTFRWLGARWHPTAQILNAYARTNVFSYFYDYDQRPPLRRGLSQFPLVPAVGLEVVF